MTEHVSERGDDAPLRPVTSGDARADAAALREQLQKLAWSLQAGGAVAALGIAAVLTWPQSWVFTLPYAALESLAPMLRMSPTTYGIFGVGVYLGIWVGGMAVDVALNGAWGLLGIWRRPYQRTLSHPEGR